MDISNACSTTNDKYRISKVLAKRVVNGQEQYLVQWDLSWENENDIYCPALIEKCEREIAQELQEEADSYLVAPPSPTQDDDNTPNQNAETGPMNAQIPTLNVDTAADSNISVISSNEFQKFVRNSKEVILTVDNSVSVTDFDCKIAEILNKYCVDGKTNYLIKWANTWESVNNINCPELIKTFERQRTANPEQHHEDPTAQNQAEPDDNPNHSGRENLVGIIDVIVRDGCYHIVVEWKLSKKISLIPLKEGTSFYTLLMEQYEASRDKS